MKQRSAVAERAEPATLQEPSLAAPTEFGYIERLEQAGLFPSTTAYKLTVKEVAAMVKRLVEEGRHSGSYRTVFFDSLAEQGLLPKPGELTGEELKKFIFMQPEEESQWRKRLAKRNQSQSQATVAGGSGPSAPDATPEQHRARVRVRKSYVNPAREDKIMVGVHVAPELKDALKKKFEQSGFDNFNEFLATGLQSLVQEPSQGLKPDAELLATALTQTRSLEKTISLLSRNVFTRLSSDSTPSR